jgi:hypothetical protein
MIRSTVSRGVGSRNRLGRDEQSSRPAGPSATNRATHLFTVLISTPKANTPSTNVELYSKACTHAMSWPDWRATHLKLCDFLAATSFTIHDVI